MLTLGDRAEPSEVPPMRPIALMSALAIGSLVAEAVTSLVMIVLYAGRIQILEAFQAHRAVDRAYAAGSDALIRLGALVLVGLVVLAASTFVCWFYRANQNLRAVRRGPFEFTPSQAAWSFFIPFVNLFRPYAVMREIWQASDPRIPPFAPEPSAITTSFRLVGWWWGIFLLRGALAWAAFVPLTLGQTADALLTNARLMEVDHLLSIVAAALACALVLRITKRQRQLGAQLVVAAA